MTSLQSVPSVPHMAKTQRGEQLTCHFIHLKHQCFSQQSLYFGVGVRLLIKALCNYKKFPHPITLIKVDNRRSVQMSSDSTGAGSMKHWFRRQNPIYCVVEHFGSTVYSPNTQLSFLLLCYSVTSRSNHGIIDLFLDTGV